MLRVRVQGRNWRKVRSILKSYNKRIDFVRLRIGSLLGDAFLQELRRIAPDAPEYRRYIESLRLVRLSGNNGVAAYGVVTGDMKERIGDVIQDRDRVDKTVVYIGISNSTIPDEAALLLAQSNPWPIQMLPEKIPDGVTLVHRIVSLGEMEWAMEKTRIFIRKNSSSLQALDLQFGDLARSKTSQQESLPDNITLALRAEFGVNTDAKPHWRPALQWLQGRMQEIIKKDDSIHRALGDWLFRGHLLGEEGETENMKVFQDTYGAFQKKVLMHG